MTARVAIVGAGGYSGAEVASILLGHPQARIVGVFGSGKQGIDGRPVRLPETFGQFRGRLDLPVLAAEEAAIAETRPDAVFLATPHEVSLHLAPKLCARGLLVLDLSAAYRLKDAAVFATYYAMTHDQPVLLERAVYGLPELFREQVRTAGMIAVPGCYPTSAILALHPLVSAGAIRKDEQGQSVRPIIDSTSGISGAGRKAEQRLMFCEVSQQAYGVFSHRHRPEIDAYAGVETVFTPHTGPFDRGILSTIHVELAKGWDEARVRETFVQAYEHERFVRVCPAETWPRVADVRGTNCCDIGLACDERGHLILCSAIDNLVKGAAGQAVQCMNVRLGFDEALGLAGARLVTGGAT